MKPSPAAPQLFSVELRTSQWGALVEWYRSVLGLMVLVRVVDDGYALLAAGDHRSWGAGRGESPLEPRV
jgi:hypothetical protein